jgi:uncharacterized membrane protein
MDDVDWCYGLREEATMAHIRKTIFINASLQKVYSVARDPNRWSTWFAGLTEPDKVTGNGEVGTVVRQKYLLAGTQFPITTRVMEDKLAQNEAFWKGKIEGPLSGEQSWSYRTREGKTEVTVDLDYTVPGSALGKIADRLVIEKMQERSTDQSLENLKTICET